MNTATVTLPLPVIRFTLWLSLIPILAGRWFLEGRARGPFDPRLSRALGGQR